MTEAAPAPVADNAAPAPVAEPPAPAITPDKPHGNATSWRDALPDDIKSSPSLAKFETQEGLAKSYISLEKMLGADKVVVPKEGDTEGWNRFYAAVGRPDKPEDYGFQKPEKIPEGMEYSPDLDQRIAKIAHARGLNKSQASGLREDLMAIVAEGGVESLNAAKAQETEAKQRRDEATSQLKQEMGKAFDQELGNAKLAVKKYGGDEFIAFLESSGLGDHPAMIRAFSKIARSTMGDGELIGASTQEQTPKDLDAAIADHQSKHSAALFDKSHPEHAIRVREREDLFNKRYPQTA